MKGQSYIITGFKVLRRIIASVQRDVILLSAIQNIINVDERATAYPDSFFFFIVNEAGRRTMRGQRARIAAATDRGIDLTLERNAYSLLAGCYFA